MLVHVCSFKLALHSAEALSPCDDKAHFVVVAPVSDDSLPEASVDVPVPPRGSPSQYNGARARGGGAVGGGRNRDFTCSFVYGRGCSFRMCRMPCGALTSRRRGHGTVGRICGAEAVHESMLAAPLDVPESREGVSMILEFYSRELFSPPASFVTTPDCNRGCVTPWG